MALDCGNNTKTYTPAGDGFHINRATAIARAAQDYGNAVGRCVGRIMRWANQPCPGNCGLRIFAGFTNGPQTSWVRARNDGRFHAHFDHAMTGIVLCIPFPAAKAPTKTPKKAKKAKKGARMRRR